MPYFLYSDFFKTVFCGCGRMRSGNTYLYRLSFNFCCSKQSTFSCIFYIVYFAVSFIGLAAKQFNLYGAVECFLFMNCIFTEINAFGDLYFIIKTFFEVFSEFRDKYAAFFFYLAKRENCSFSCQLLDGVGLCSPRLSACEPWPRGVYPGHVFT